MSTLNNHTKFTAQRSGMTHAQWRHAQDIHRSSAARWFFNTALAKPGVNCTERNQSTYNIGRNANKRRIASERTYLRNPS